MAETILGGAAEGLAGGLRLGMEMEAHRQAARIRELNIAQAEEEAAQRQAALGAQSKLAMSDALSLGKQYGEEAGPGVETAASPLAPGLTPAESGAGFGEAVPSPTAPMTTMVPGEAALTPKMTSIEDVASRTSMTPDEKRWLLTTAAGQALMKTRGVHSKKDIERAQELAKAERDSREIEKSVIEKAKAGDVMGAHQAELARVRKMKLVDPENAEKWERQEASLKDSILKQATTKGAGDLNFAWNKKWTAAKLEWRKNPTASNHAKYMEALGDAPDNDAARAIQAHEMSQVTLKGNEAPEYAQLIEAMKVEGQKNPVISSNMEAQAQAVKKKNPQMFNEAVMAFMNSGQELPSYIAKAAGLAGAPKSELEAVWLMTKDTMNPASPGFNQLLLKNLEAYQSSKQKTGPERRAMMSTLNALLHETGTEHRKIEELRRKAVESGDTATAQRLDDELRASKALYSSLQKELGEHLKVEVPKVDTEKKYYSPVNTGILKRANSGNFVDMYKKEVNRLVTQGGYTDDVAGAADAVAKSEWGDTLKSKFPGLAPQIEKLYPAGAKPVVPGTAPKPGEPGYPKPPGAPEAAKPAPTPATPSFARGRAEAMTILADPAEKARILSLPREQQAGALEAALKKKPPVTTPTAASVAAPKPTASPKQVSAQASTGKPAAKDRVAELAADPLLADIPTRAKYAKVLNRVRAEFQAGKLSGVANMRELMSLVDQAVQEPAQVTVKGTSALELRRASLASKGLQEDQIWKQLRREGFSETELGPEPE